ncbi:MAG: hypothetical protein AAGA01_12775, partial [Cyanobacteria bacterium P01_E01_bin.43]
MPVSSQSKWSLVGRSLTPYLFLVPALLVLGLTVFWPAMQALYLSFTSYGFDVTQPPLWIGLANFQELLSDRTFWTTVKNTLLLLKVSETNPQRRLSHIKAVASETQVQRLHGGP